MTDAPKRIWLVMEDEVEEFPDRENWEYLLWSDSEVNSRDIEYVRADDYRALMRAAHALCRLSQPFNRHTPTPVRELWELCKDYDPTEE